MKRVVLILGGVLVALYVALIFVPIDPVERRPGTRLSGDPPTALSFLQGRTQAWLETRTWYLIPHSITVSAWADDGTLYVGCSRCDTKTWPKHVARDNRVRLKIGDEIHMRRAMQITDPVALQAAMGEREVGSGFALFRMDPR